MKKTTITLFLFLYLLTGTAWTQVSSLQENHQLTFGIDGLGLDRTIFGYDQVRLVGDDDLSTNTIGTSLIHIVDNSKTIFLTTNNFSLQDNNSSKFVTLQENVMAMGFINDNFETHSFELRQNQSPLQMGIQYDDGNNVENTFMLFDVPSSSIGVNLDLGTSPLAFLYIKESDFSSGDGLAFQNNGDGNDIWSWGISTDDLILYYSATGFFGNDVAFIEADDGTWNPNSDRRLKKDISPLENNTLEKVLQFEPVSYRFKHTEGAVPKTIGFIAQQIESVFPELVKHREDGFYALNYDEFAVVAIKAIQERHQLYEKQENAITEIEAQNEKLKNTLAALEEKLEKLEAALEGNSPSPSVETPPVELGTAETDQTHLAQNIPNPFSKQTTIRYTLPKHFSIAQIQIADQQGRIVKSQKLKGNGQGEWLLQAKSLTAGIYTYTLIIDGKAISTKQMILTQ